MSIAIPTAFSEADLDRLETLLDDDIFQGEAMLLDEIQALFCALISGPQTVSPEDWLPIVLSSAMERLPAGQLQQISELLLSYYRDLEMRLANDEPWDLILYPLEEAEATDDDSLDFATWADAYVYGSQLGCNWYDAVGDHAEQLTELLQPFFLLNGMLREDAHERGEPWMSASQEQAALAQARDSLPDLIVEIYAFWAAKRASDQAIGSASEAPGKPRVFSAPAANDACPCGSGKAFSQCCGSPAKLH